MGAGISLGEYHIAEIIKRDLAEKHADRMSNLPDCAPQYTTWRNFIENSHHESTVKQIDRLTERVVQHKTSQSV
jgi:hypothetical protein